MTDRNGDDPRIERARQLVEQADKFRFPVFDTLDELINHVNVQSAANATLLRSLGLGGGS